MAENQSEHRKSLEQQVIKSDISNSRKGLLFGLLIGLAGLIAAVIISIKGSEVAGSIIGVGTLASLVSTFVYGSRERSQEREERRTEDSS